MTDTYETAKALRVEICHLYGIDPNNCPGEAIGRFSDWSSCNEVLKWLKAGWEPGWIRGVLTEVAHGRKNKFWHPDKMSYFTKILAKKAKEAEELPKAPEQKPEASSRAALVARVRYYNMTRRWTYDGQYPPDDPKCTIPADIIAEAEARRSTPVSA